jgi:hypothetical protein
MTVTKRRILIELCCEIGHGAANRYELTESGRALKPVIERLPAGVRAMESTSSQPRG